MSDNKNQSIQLDDIMRILEALERRLSRLENSFDVHRRAFDTMSDNMFAMFKRICSLGSSCVRINEKCDDMKTDIGSLKEIYEKLDDMETDIDLLYALAHSCDNFCGNCTHCKQYPDGIYKCDITACEIDPDTSSCIRFESPQPPKSDAEICKACSDKDTPRCYKYFHFPF